MSNPERKLRANAANKEAKLLGYRIEVEMELNRKTHTAFAYPVADEAAERHFLCRRHSPPIATGDDAIATLEDGLNVLRGVVEGGNPWPGEAR